MIVGVLATSGAVREGIDFYAQEKAQKYAEAIKTLTPQELEGLKTVGDDLYDYVKGLQPEQAEAVEALMKHGMKIAREGAQKEKLTGE